MFTKFNYLPTHRLSWGRTSAYYAKGLELYHTSQAQARECLENFICEKDIIDGSALKEHWFSIDTYDVFLSHSHKDYDDVLSFAGWLHDKFGLCSFIDSCAWGYCNDLLKILDDKYCWNRTSGLYDYNIRNYTTSHVHMMLSTALTEMIDKCECIIFFNTPQSISIDTALRTLDIDDKRATLSPWIYHELSITSMLRQTIPERIRQRYLLEHADSILKYNKIPDIKYDVHTYLKEMVDIDDTTLLTWAEKCPLHNTDTLDALYQLVNSR